MTGQKPASESTAARMISVKLQLENNHQVELSLSEDSPELATLFRILASRGSDAIEPVEQFLQLPLDDGKAACSFNSRQLVSVITQPPVVVRLEQQAATEAPGPELANESTPSPVVVDTPRYMIIDDFLGPDEHREMLAFAVSQEEKFETGTAEGRETPHRNNKVIMDFAETSLSRLLCNRLLTCLPLLSRELEIPLFPVRHVESQLTASNDGHYYHMHCDSGSTDSEHRTITCVYYLFREPRPFNGGSLRLYDSIYQGDQREACSNYREVEVVSNRLVIFPSSAYHELMRIRCPSRKFADSRFAITNWIHANTESQSDDTHGWGHLHCGVVPLQFVQPEEDTP